MATLVSTTHAFQFTTEELHVLSQAMKALLDNYASTLDSESGPDDQIPEEWWSLQRSIERPISFEMESKRLQESAHYWKQKCNFAKSMLQDHESPVIKTAEMLAFLY